MAHVKKAGKPLSYLGEPCAPKEKNDLTCPSLYLNREINWLDFNSKVLEQALDARLPLLEQVKFLAIFHNNLDEFFMVRVANILHQYHNGIASSSWDKLTPARQLAEIRRRTLALLEVAQTRWRKRLLPQLGERGVRLVRYRELSDKQKRFLDGYFQNEIYPVLTPQAIDPSHPFPTISNVSLNFIVQLRDADGTTRFARLKCPGNVSRFVFVPRTKEAKTYASLGFSANVRDDDILLMEDLVREYLSLLFSGFTVISAGVFRITRNTDVEIEEDEADDLLEAVKDLVEQRRFGNIVRLEIAHGMASELTAFLVKRLELKPFQVYRVKGPLAFSDFTALYGIDRPGLKDDPFHPHIPQDFSSGDIFHHVARHDVFLYHPYVSFTPVLDFIRRASEDPGVIAIKQTLYRVGNDSPVVRALIEARRQRKQVTAVVELKARFDEERNITWAEELEKAGVNVVYGLVGMKIHAKLCLVVRREADGVRRYVHIGTGNYNPATAKIYADMGLITADPDICADVTDLFNVMTGYAQRNTYRALLVSPVSMRKTLLDLIEKERTLHVERGKGEIVFKCNQLVDSAIIRALYRASMAGVRVRLQVRGICCLRPGVPGISDNIEVKSVVGRFLEHSRVFWFGGHDDGRLYIGSADLMPRNLDRRVEVLVPILDAGVRRMIRHDILETHLNDNVQAWRLREDGTYLRLKPGKGKEAVNSQERMADYMKFFMMPESEGDDPVALGDGAHEGTSPDSTAPDGVNGKGTASAEPSAVTSTEAAYVIRGEDA